MSARIFVLCLLSSVISTTASLRCQTCFSSREQCKNEDMKMEECGPNEGQCLTLSFSSNMMDPSLSFTYKACATPEQCSVGYYDFTSLDNKYQQIRIACCENDGCNTAPLPFPGRDLMKPNGFTCPGSYEQNGSSEESGPVLCLGNEDQCFNAKFTTTAMSAFQSTVTAQGCTTKNTCTYIGDVEQGHGILRFSIDKMECQDPHRLEGRSSFSRRFGWKWN